jgi:asparagine N-glycosylation enzyme membrane subunit Stt3
VVLLGAFLQISDMRLSLTVLQLKPSDPALHEIQLFFCSLLILFELIMCSSILDLQVVYDLDDPFTVLLFLQLGLLLLFIEVYLRGRISSSVRSDG